MRNVSHLVLRPSGHTGKAKKGHLIFDAAFESGTYIQIYINIKVTLTTLICTAFTNISRCNEVNVRSFFNLIGKERKATVRHANAIFYY